MANFLEKLLALNTPGPHRAERVDADTALKGGRHPVLEHPKPNTVLGTPLAGYNSNEWDATAHTAGTAETVSAAEAGGVGEETAETQQASGRDEIIIGLGCFWGGEKLFWNLPGVLGTSVGYAGGYTQNPTYREVCTGRTGHTEAVRIVFDPARTNVENILKVMFENHDPTQGDRQGNDVGSQYRSAVYTSGPNPQAQLETVRKAVDAWQGRFMEKGFGTITTEIAQLSEAGCGEYFLAEDEHQQYLHKNPAGYCAHGPNGVSCPTGVL